MIQKKVVLIVYLLVILGVFYFVYNAFISQTDQVPTSIETQNDALSSMKDVGVSDFQAKTINNSDFKLSQITTPIIIINFWASWCGPCVEEFPSMLELLKTMDGKVSLVALSVDSDSSQMELFLKNYNIDQKNLYLLKDPEYFLAQNFGTFKIPESYIINKDRKLLRKVSGSIDWTSSEVVGFLNDSL